VGMTDTSHTLLAEIDAFLAATGMGESYFGKRAVGNSELVARLRRKRRVWPETAEKVRGFMQAHTPPHAQPAPADQGAVAKRAGT